MSKVAPAIKTNEQQGQLNMLKLIKNNRYLLTFFIIAACIALYYFINKLSANNQEQRTVKVGLFEYPPYNMTDPTNGKPTGYCVDILNAVAKDQKLTINYVNTLFINYKNDITKGEPYIMGLPIIITAEREKIYDFSWPCEENDIVLVVPASNKTPSIESMKNQCIGSVQGIEKALCQKLLKEGKIKSHKAFHSTAKLYEALLAGEIDAIINDRGISNYFKDKYPGKINVTNIVFINQYEAFPIQKQQKWLLKRINNGLRNIMNSGEYSTIYCKYFSNP